MNLIARTRSWTRALLHRSRMEEEMDRELRFHITQYENDLARSGMAPDEARRRALSEFGGVERRKDECRQALGLRLADEVIADVRYTLRQLRRSKAFTATAVLSLALGIGANTAIFSLMETALWQSLPVTDPRELRLLSWVSGPKRVMSGINGSMDTTPGGGSRSTSFSYPAFLAFERQPDQFDTLFAFKPIRRVTAVIDGQAELLDGELVSGRFFEGLGVRPAIGRSIEPKDDVRTATETVAVISDGFWARRFGRSASVIGTRIEINRVPVTIIGVNPPRFEGLEVGANPDVFLPISHQPSFLVRTGQKPWLDNPDMWWVLVMGRLGPGADHARAQEGLDRVLQQTVRSSLPDRHTRDQARLELVSGARGLDELSFQFRRPLLVLLGVAGLILLMACANIANLLLARAAARQREISLRLALGAGRWRVLRQLLTEGLTLSILGGAGGILLGYWLRDSIPSLLATSWRPGPFDATFTGRVLLLAVLITLLTGVVFSVSAAWRSALVEIATVLKDAGRTVLPLPRWSRGKPLVVLQIAVSVVLVIGAGLFIRTLVNIQSTTLGFKPDRVLLFAINTSSIQEPAQRMHVFEQIEEGIGRIPGVESATVSSDVLVARSSSTTMVNPLEPGATGASPTAEPPSGDPLVLKRAWVNDVGDRFFETMGIPILAGRALQRTDRAGTPRAAVVSQEFVRQYFPGSNPVGRRFLNGTRVLEVVGIAADTRYDTVQRPFPPTFYRAYRQEPATGLGTMTFEVRTSVGNAAIIPGIREVIRSVDGNLPMFDVRTQIEQIEATSSQERLFVALTSAFGLLALVLACLGIYGIMANSVARRTNEFGIRLALGASRSQVVRMVLRDSFSLAIAGVVAGVLIAAGLSRYVRTMLYGVEPVDPVATLSAVALILAVAAVAAWIPARRASRLEPVTALRHE